MSLTDAQQTAKDFVLKLIESACNYQLETLETLYSDDLIVATVMPDGSVQSLDYQAVMGLFHELKNSGAPAIETTAQFNLIDVQGDLSYVIVTRYMDLFGQGRQKIVFSLMLRKSNDTWQIYREHAVVVS